MNWFTSTKDEAETASAWFETALKLIALVVALAGAASGIYAAWFKPETKAREAYTITSGAVESLAKDLEKVNKALEKSIEAHNALDKAVSVDLAKINQRLDDFEKFTKHRPQATVVVEEKTAPAVVHKIEPDRPKDSPVKREGLQMQMPAPADVF